VLVGQSWAALRARPAGLVSVSCREWNRIDRQPVAVKRRGARPRPGNILCCRALVARNRDVRGAAGEGNPQFLSTPLLVSYLQIRLFLKTIIIAFP
jgi:hypothetical protein